MSFISVYAQTSGNPKKKNTFKFSLGYNFGALKNLEIAPISRYDYVGLVYKFGYERISKRQNLLSIEFDYLESQLKTDVIPVLNLNYTKSGLSLSYLKQIYHKDKLSVHLGLKSYTNLSTYLKENISRDISNQSFSIASKFNYSINNKHSLSSKLSIPVILYRATHTSSEIHSLKKYQSISWDLSYKYSLSSQLQFVFNYNFHYDRVHIISAFREIQQQINLGILFKF